jgi:hypothetical protein
VVSGVGQDRLGPSYFFTSLVLGPLNSLVWWEVPLGYIALRSFLFLQEHITDIIIKSHSLCASAGEQILQPVCAPGESDWSRGVPAGHRRLLHTGVCHVVTF